MRKCSETRITAHKTSFFIGSSFPLRSASGILPETHRNQTAAVAGLLKVDPGAFWCQAFFGKRTPDAFVQQTPGHNSTEAHFKTFAASRIRIKTGIRGT